MFTKYLRIFALILIFAGLCGIIPLNYYNLRAKIAVAEAQGISKPLPQPQLPASAALVTGQPVEIDIPSLKIDLAVVPGIYNAKTGQWNLSLTQAQFAEPSVQPNNEIGNTLIYGHYRPEVFAYLHLIKPGAQAIIKTSNGYSFTYTYEGSIAYQPTDTSIFSNEGLPRLTIQTCSGEFMQNRQMYAFSYDGYAKS
jgi:sortase (surface protein transpeptidase)